MLQICFILLTIALVVTLYIITANVALKAITNIQQQRYFIRKTALVLISWLIYITALSVTGIFANPSFPPRIPLLLVAPALVFIIYFFTAKRFKKIIAFTPPVWLVYFQSFRIIVELLIWWMFLRGIVPRSATFDGHNFDILIGLTAPFIAYFTFTKPILGKPVLILWNITGLTTLGIVVFILMKHTYYHAIPNDPNNILTSILTKGSGLGMFPYTFLPGIFMPLALFMHIFSLIKIKQRS